MTLRPLALLLAPITLLGACASSPTETVVGAGEGAIAVLPGKADNYLSPTSQEWLLGSTGKVTLEDRWADATPEDKEAAANELLAQRFKAFSHFVNEYLTDKSSHDANAGYGGFAGLVRDRSLDFLVEPVGDDGMTWEFVWTLELGGPADLPGRLDTHAKGSETAFDVLMPKLSEAELASTSYPSHFDPSTWQGETETLEVTISSIAQSVDAWPEYPRLFEDGIFDVLVIVGGDYNEARYDRTAAKGIFDWLKKAGYAHPAREYTELTLSSAPFTKTLRTPAGDVGVRVALVFPDIVPDADLDLLRARIVQGFETADMVVYDGHAGQDPDYSGVAYHYNPRKAISANELAELALPEKYQVFVFNGCKTYNAYPDALYKSPVKTTKNLDIISTVSFSWLSMQPFTTSGLLTYLLQTRSGQHDPATWVEVLTQINKSNNSNVYYGVHGLDDNPHRNPYADVASLCATCGGDGDCPGVGNRCVRFEWGSACAAECTDDDGCPAGYRCSQIAEGGHITGRQCLPQSYTCR